MTEKERQRNGVIGLAIVGFCLAILLVAALKSNKG